MRIHLEIETNGQLTEAVKAKAGQAKAAVARAIAIALEAIKKYGLPVLMIAVCAGVIGGVIDAHMKEQAKADLAERLARIEQNRPAQELRAKQIRADRVSDFYADREPPFRL
jgi:hypothetical protein